MSLRELNYPQAASWVRDRCTTKTSESEVSAALHSLAHAAARAEADCAVEGLFPGSGLEVLLSRDLDGQAPSLPPLPVKVELDAMRAIGEAIGCPARAGIGPTSAMLTPSNCRLPRASGDRPCQLAAHAHGAEVAPRERG